ncbi:MAG: lipoyl(octanoyl) transferase LipB [Planctomycetota bacterium]|jgi:lipoate-protein ligase B|nr:MAG: lipoyl(octanoyl) transferase LipB [Planctomycetota bacterium]
MITLASNEHVSVIDLGAMAYADALQLQRETHERVVAARNSRAPMTVFVLEHVPAVITVSRRPSAPANVLASDEVLAQHGIMRVETDRGGDVTYHGPGQLVVYPILDIERLGLRVHPYVRFLEQCVIDVLAADGLTGLRDTTATGVWIGANGVAQRKIAAIGVRLSRYVSLHGFALNIAPNLAHFKLINSCGLNRAVTSIAAEIGERTPTIEVVKDRVAEWFVRETARHVEVALHSRNEPS